MQKTVRLKGSNLRTKKVRRGANGKEKRMGGRLSGVCERKGKKKKNSNTHIEILCWEEGQQKPLTNY